MNLDREVSDPKNLLPFECRLEEALPIEKRLPSAYKGKDVLFSEYDHPRYDFGKPSTN